MGEVIMLSKYRAPSVAPVHLSGDLSERLNIAVDFPPENATGYVIELSSFSQCIIFDEVFDMLEEIKGVPVYASPENYRIVSALAIQISDFIMDFENCSQAWIYFEGLYPRAAVL